MNLLKNKLPTWLVCFCLIFTTSIFPACNQFSTQSGEPSTDVCNHSQHEYDNACDAICNICNTKRVITHTYDNACDKICNICGEERSVPNHAYDDDYDATCNVCGATRTLDTSDENDLANLQYVSTKIINNWVVHSNLTMQRDYAYGASKEAIKGSFHYTMGEAYTGYGGNHVWTAVCLDLEKVYGACQNLKNSVIRFDLKVENCNSMATLTVMKKDEVLQTEHGFNVLPTNADGIEGITKTVLNNDWVRFNVYPEYLFDSTLLAEIKYFVLVFSNVQCNEAENSVFYLDNISVGKSNSTINWFTGSYNPDGYYTNDKPLKVHIVGNSFIAYSSTAQWLQTFATVAQKSLTVSYDWTPNGRIPDQYEKAFGHNGYMTETFSPDILYVQDFYSFSDAIALSDFAKKLAEISPTTELKVYNAENETQDGMKAAQNLGIDLVDWRAAIKYLKTQGYSASHLNDVYDGWHPNVTSGFVGALMIYMDIYGEVPNVEGLLQTTVLSVHGYKESIYDYLLGYTEADKKASLASIVAIAKQYVLDN